MRRMFSWNGLHKDTAAENVAAILHVVTLNVEVASIPKLVWINEDETSSVLNDTAMQF